MRIGGPVSLERFISTLLVAVVLWAGHVCAEARGCESHEKEAACASQGHDADGHDDRCDDAPFVCCQTWAPPEGRVMLAAPERSLTSTPLLAEITLHEGIGFAPPEARGGSPPDLVVPALLILASPDRDRAPPLA